MKYLALSYFWGSNSFHTTRAVNFEQSRVNIDPRKLSLTHTQAIEVARELGFRYLWIDALCIIQDVKDDWIREANRMGDVYASAYCVLAASSSPKYLHKTQSPREYVTFAREGLPPFYVCNFIDNFNEDVLESPLSKRAWTFQDRVLAHRTIYFTDTQTYWECGAGVRCQTLTRMQK